MLQGCKTRRQLRAEEELQRKLEAEAEARRLTNKQESQVRDRNSRGAFVGL